MKTNVKTLRAILAIMLCLTMLFCFSACGDDKSKDDGIVYGDETDDDFGNGDTEGDSQDGDVITNTTESGSSGGNNAQNYDDGLVNKNQIDDNKKKDFLLSVPKKYSGQEVTILVWWDPFDYEIEKMQRFTEATGIKVKFVYADSASYMQKLSSLKLQKNSPDIACITAGQYPSAIIQDYFQPIDNSKLSFNKETFDLDSMNKLKWNGKRYGAIIKGNSHINFGIMLYNADMFRKHGVTDPHTLWQQGNWNWDTLVSTAQDIQKKSGITALSTEYHGYRLSQSSGEDAVIFKDGKLVNNTASENYRSAYKFIYNLGTKGQYKVMDAGLNRDGFMSGQCAMFLDDSWALQSGERYEKLSFTLGFAPIPCKKGINAVPSDFQLWGFPVGAKNTEAAAYVLEYWLSPQFDEKGHTTWVNESAAAMLDYLWEQPKVFKLSTGAIEYGGDYDWWDYNQQCAEKGNDINATMDRWSNVITENLRKIYLD
ncbi:MAG: extracellular solute-binding protein [Ruminococcaceae bacterium]|nr:extracellular solute-binding protein [Oscillospiraceae bacterium]